MPNKMCQRKIVFEMNALSCCDVAIDKIPCIPSGMRSYVEAIK